MALTVDRPMVVTSRQAFALAEVVDKDTATGGPRNLASMINTLYEQKRGSLIADHVDTAGGTIAKGLGSIGRYRCKVQGYGELTSEDLEVWLYVNAVGGAPSPAMVVTVTETTAAVSVTWTYSGDVTGWVQPATTQLQAITDDAEYLDIEVEITTATDMTIANVNGVAIFYARDKSALDAVTAGEEGYLTNGFVPIERTFFDGEKPLASVWLHHMHEDLIDLYERRGSGQCIACARDTGDFHGGITYVDVPTSRGSDTIELIVWVYAERHASGNGEVTITTPDFTWTTTVDKDDWYTGGSPGTDNLVTVPISGERRQIWVKVEAGGANLPDIESVCAWWGDATYG